MSENPRGLSGLTDAIRLVVIGVVVALAVAAILTVVGVLGDSVQDAPSDFVAVRIPV